MPAGASSAQGLLRSAWEDIPRQSRRRRDVKRLTAVAGQYASAKDVGSSRAPFAAPARPGGTVKAQIGPFGRSGPSIAIISQSVIDRADQSPASRHQTNRRMVRCKPILWAPRFTSRSYRSRLGSPSTGTPTPSSCLTSACSPRQAARLVGQGRQDVGERRQRRLNAGQPTVGGEQ